MAGNDIDKGVIRGVISENGENSEKKLQFRKIEKFRKSF